MIGLSQKHIEAIRQQWDGDLYPCNAEFYALCDLALLGLRAAGEEQEAGDSICKESDGCPTERAVLQRFWREAQAAAPPASAPEPVADAALRAIAKRHSHAACAPVNALHPAHPQEEFRLQEVIFYALKEATAHGERESYSQNAIQRAAAYIDGDTNLVEQIIDELNAAPVEALAPEPAKEPKGEE